MTQQELEKYLWGAATYLRGTIDAGDYKQYIFPLLFFKRISDVYEEEYQIALKDSHRDLELAKKYAKQLDRLNKSRREIESSMVNDAELILAGLSETQTNKNGLCNRHIT